jgi:urocanate reductase
MKMILMSALVLIMGTSLIACNVKTKSVSETKEDTDTVSQASLVVDEAGLYKLPVISPSPERETEQTYDVVVIGAGGAGFSAAISAAEKGAKVVILEQESVVGGNTSRSGAQINAPGNWVQKSLGIEDSIELYKNDTMKGGDNKNSEALVTVLANRVLTTVEWLKNNVGVEFMDDYQNQFGGNSVRRSLGIKGSVGSQMIYKMYETAYGMGITIKVNTKAEDLITDANGRVIGVKASNKSDQDLTFNATQGVILTTGGFAGNAEMRMKYRPELNESLKTTNAPGHDGSGITMAQKLDAGTRDMEYIQSYPFCFSTTGQVSFISWSRMYGALMVNVEGKRFVDENERRDVVTNAILAQSDISGYLVADSKIMEESRVLELYKKEFQDLLSEKQIVVADTLEEAADFFGIDKAELLATVERYNAYTEDNIVNGTPTEVADKEFARTVKMQKIEEGPFYIQKNSPSIHHTMGGLTIDTNTHVVTSEGNVIEGLYAAGEVVGGVHGTNRLGGNALASITVFGFIAGETVVADAQ